MVLSQGSVPRAYTPRPHLSLPHSTPSPPPNLTPHPKKCLQSCRFFFFFSLFFFSISIPYVPRHSGFCPERLLRRPPVSWYPVKFISTYSHYNRITALPVPVGEKRKEGRGAGVDRSMDRFGNFQTSAVSEERKN